MGTMFTNHQYNNIQRGLHPDCCADEVCSACGVSEANLQACRGEPSELAQDLWRAAIRHDHNADPARVLHPSHVNDATLLDRAAREIWARDSVRHAERENAERSGAVEAEGCQSGGAERRIAHQPIDIQGSNP